MLLAIGDGITKSARMIRPFQARKRESGRVVAAATAIAAAKFFVRHSRTQ